MTCAVCQAGSSVLPSRTGAATARDATAEVALARDGISTPSILGWPILLETTTREVLSGGAGVCAKATAGNEIKLKRTRIFMTGCDWRLASCRRERPKTTGSRLRQRQPG